MTIWKQTMSKKKKANKEIRAKHTMTLKEMEEQGLVPKDFHLFDGVEMKEWQEGQPGYKEWEQGLAQDEDFYGPNKDVGV